MLWKRRISAGVWSENSHEQRTDTVLWTKERFRAEKKQRSLMYVWAFARFRFVGHAAGIL